MPKQRRDIIIGSNRQLSTAGTRQIPQLFRNAGEHATRRFVEFFTANIRNPNTREAYSRAVYRFSDWCEKHHLALESLNPPLVALYVEELMKEMATPSVKQHLAAIRMLCDYVVVGQGMAFNPASSVRGPKHIVSRGKTPVLMPDQARVLLDSIETNTLKGLRDRAMIATMVFSFARVSALLSMNVEDYFPEGKRWWFRLHEKGGKRHEVPVHHKAEECLDAYMAATGFSEEPRAPLFRSINQRGEITERRMHRRDALEMVKRRAIAAGLPSRIGCHTFRATGITAYMLNGGTLEHAQRIAAHASPKTTKLYDRTMDEISLDEIERIVL